MPLDDVVCVKEPHDKRRQCLYSLVEPSPGRAEIGRREEIDFAAAQAAEFLEQAFARPLAPRWKGLRLKGYNDPYYCFSTNCRPLKLKKDYILGLGDTVDFSSVLLVSTTGLRPLISIGSLVRIFASN